MSMLDKGSLMQELKKECLLVTQMGSKATGFGVERLISELAEMFNLMKLL